MLSFYARKIKRQRYARGFMWGRREHRAEELTTKVLLLSFIVLAAHTLSGGTLIDYVVTLLVLFALGLRLVATFCHKREKKYMDELRFHRKKKGRAAK